IWQDLVTTIGKIDSGSSEFGRDCHEVNCATGERCVVSHVACEKDQRDGEHCGLYPRCVEIELRAGTSSPTVRPLQASKCFISDQQLIDTTSTTANARAPIFSPSTSTIQLNNRLSLKSASDLDSGFELLSPEAGIDPSVSHADQLQANVLVIVQDGTQQPNRNLNPNIYPNYNRQPCVPSPYYPYTCNYAQSSFLPASRSVSGYPNARAAPGPQLVPPTPPCYYNCYPRLTGSYPRLTNSYPLARSVQPSSALTNNYLLYITI
ncbi:hypothetical protein KR222_000072, partial [Zaprionus bogoriensis]